MHIKLIVYSLVLFLSITNALCSDLEIYVSNSRGFYDNTFQLYIETNDPNAAIRYTTNRNRPTTTSGTIYNGPISISATSLVRIIAYNSLEEDEETHTYIFPNNIIAQSYMENYIKNDNTYGAQLYDALKSLPVVSLVTPNNTIDDINEIEGSFEIFTDDGSLSEQENCGAKLYGFTSVDLSRKKNHRFYFREIYGASKLEAKLFEGFENGISAVTNFDQIELRGISQEGFSDSNFESYTYVGSNFLDNTMLQMGNLHSHSRFVHFYVNGEYRGQYALRERMNDDFMKSYFGGVETDYEAISGSGGGNLAGNWSPGTAFDGTGAMYNSMVAQSTNFDSWKNYVNTASYFDFMLNFMWGNHENEMKAVGNITDPTKFIFRVNDGDGAFTYYDGHLGVTIDRTNPNGTGSHNLAGHNNIFKNLYNEADSDFFIEFADRVECHCFNDGALTPNQTQQRIDALANEMQLSIVADVARWGSSSEGEYPYVWSNQIDQVKQNFLPSRTGILVNQLKNRNLYPTTDAVSFNQYGGIVNSSFQLVLSNPNSGGQIYYTLDGTDPRNDGGSINSNAILYNGSVNLPDGVYTVKARIYRSNVTDKWSAMCPRKFYVNQNYSNLVINEIHYNPEDSIYSNASTGANDTISGRDFEFIELKNNSQNTIFLEDVSFIKGITLNFEANYSIPAGGFLVLAENEIRFAEKYGFAPDGQYQGKLDNGGENIWIVDPFENLIDTLRYDDNLPWDTIPDNGKFSLALIDANLDNSDYINWSSQVVYTTPKAENLFCNTISGNPIIANVSCNGKSDGYISLNPSNGTAPYSYQWSNGSTASFISTLVAGSYSVSIFDNFLCEVTLYFNITEPPALQLTSSFTNETYFGSNDGSATATVTGGVPSYTYSWSNGANTSSVSNLAPGNYSVDIYDSYNCLINASFNIEAIDCSSFSITTNKTDETYFQTNDGTAGVTAIGTTPYNYSWSNGASTQNINNLSPANYTITVTDAVGCSDNASVNIQAIDCQPLAVSVNTTNETCIGNSDGLLIINNVQNGTAPYSYLWSTGITGTVINNLSSGNYGLTVTDAKGCPFNNSYIVNAASPISASSNTTNVSSVNANDGSIEVNVSGGLAPYSFDWSNGAATQNIYNLTTGNYDLVITDNNNCEITVSNIQIDNGCMPNLTHNTQPNITSGTYQVSDYIQSDCTVDLDKNVSFKAGQYIELNNFFEIKIGAEFEAIIDGCQ